MGAEKIETWEEGQTERGALGLTRLWHAGAHCDFDFAQLVEQDVSGLEVVVDDAAGGPIQVGQPIKDLTGNCLGFLLWQYLHQPPLQCSLERKDWEEGSMRDGGREGMWVLERGQR